MEAEHLLGELRGHLGLERLSGVRIIRRYDVEGVDQEAYEGRPHHRLLRAPGGRDLGRGAARPGRGPQAAGG